MKVIWSNFASDELKSIYKYYKEVASVKTAKKIKASVFEATKQLVKFSKSGTKEENLRDLKEDHRYLVAGKFKVIYKIEDNTIYITDVFNCEQNPQKMRDNAENS